MSIQIRSYIGQEQVSDDHRQHFDDPHEPIENYQMSRKAIHVSPLSTLWSTSHLSSNAQLESAKLPFETVWHGYDVLPSFVVRPNSNVLLLGKLWGCLMRQHVADS